MMSLQLLTYLYQSNVCSFTTDSMNKTPENGTRLIIDDTDYVYYYGYWIRYYEPLSDTLGNRKLLIDSLTRRAFHHTEAGICTPGKNLDHARTAYELETDPARKRVNAAMLAGSLFHRATDLFTSIVDLGELGVKVSRDNELMRQCSACFQEALALGKQVKHYSGCEGIDEIWGEPFKAFTMTPADFYESRFVKIAQSKRDIDLIRDQMISTFNANALFAACEPIIQNYADASKQVAETMKKDVITFRIWPNFVALAEALDTFEPELPDDADQLLLMHTGKGQALLREGKRLLNYIANARVPMPLGTKDYIEKCQQYQPL
ncbi:MAG: hypothetical protein ACI8ZV_002413 [Chitinophagales bacterium]|jgi:hypothetical protein